MKRIVNAFFQKYLLLNEASVVTNMEEWKRGLVDY